MIYHLLNFASLILSILAIWMAVYFFIQKFKRKKNLERSLNMVFLKVMVTSKESKSDKDEEQAAGVRDFKENIDIAKQFYDTLNSLYDSSFKGKLRGQDFISFEYVTIEDQIYFYIATPYKLATLIEKQVTSFYPDAYIEQSDEYNIFKKSHFTAAKTFTLKKHFKYPITTYKKLSTDPINNITNALSKMSFDDGATIQIIIRPIVKWQKELKEELKILRGQKKKKALNLNLLKLITETLGYVFFEAKEKNNKESDSKKESGVTEEEIKAMEDKSLSHGFECVIRIVVASSTKEEAKSNLTNIVSAFSQFASPSGNGFSGVKYLSEQKTIQNYIFRHFNYNWHQKYKKQKCILSSEELASIFHFPCNRFNKTPGISWQNYKMAPAPKNIPKEGLYLGENYYRGVKIPIYIKREDRFRHFYVIGQTGTGKSSLFQSMIRQDFKNGDGIAIIDPHGQLIDDVLPHIPKERADDVIYFNPADQARPMGLNLLEAESDDEKELVALDAMNIMIKLFGNEIFGPRIQDYFRNGCLTLMAHPEGGTLTDIVRLFTDDNFQMERVKYLKNPVVKSFWHDQMAKTGAREKQEIIPYFAAKFGQFITNAMLRNIIGQNKSGFDFINVMQNKNILLMNLSKGEVGDINSDLLGLIIVSKLQMAALRRQRFSKEERTDFFMYIDEFQNYITDSIESILSEARKYRLSLNMAHQYIAQLEGKDGKSRVKEAVFGNVGTIMSYKIGAQDAEYMAKEMAPVFSEQDLINMDKYKGVMKLSIDTQPSKPFSIIPPNPYLENGDKKIGEAIKQLSRLKYGRDREFLEREITRRIGILDDPAPSIAPPPSIF